tara:strand:- start:10749 stop:11168 length:420 start_codon:yes stop_codon:yes gene_type:complete
MQHYFAYGSNLHHAQMKRRCPKCKYIEKYILNDYQLAFRNGGWADIEKKKGKRVYGAIYIISKCAERRLDVYEDYPVLYKKMYFKYKNKKVMTYTMSRKTKLVPPTSRYLNIIKKGYKDCKLNIKSLKIALQPLAHLQR